jgi:integrase
MEKKLTQSKRSKAGNVRQLGSGMWQVQYTDPNKVRRSAGTFKTEKQAEAARSAVYTDMARGQWEDGTKGDVLFSAFLEEVLEIEKAKLAPQTVAGYESLTNRWLLPTFGKKKLNQITVLAVDRWYASLGSKTGPVNQRNSYFRLSGIMKKAVRYKLITQNPCMIENAGRDVAAPRPFLPIEDFQRIIGYMPEDIQPAMWVALGAHTRLGELCGLNRGDLDLEAGTLVVQRQVQDVPGGLQIRKTKTGKVRTVKLPTVALEAARHHVKANPSLPSAPLFIGPRGGRLPRNHVHNEWVKAATKAELPGAHFHDVRHLGLTLAAQAGATTKELMARAGHSTTAASIRYQHSTTARDAVVADMMNNLMSRQA